MLLAEDLLTLLTKRAAEGSPRRRGTQAALATAMLMELGGAGRLGADRDDAGQVHVFVADPTPLGEPLLDRALAALVAVGRVSIRDAVLAVVPDLYLLLLDSLAKRGVLTYRLGWWWLSDRPRRELLRRGLVDVLLGGVAPDWASGALISLLDMLNATSVLTRDPAATRRGLAIGEGDWPAGEVVGTIAPAGAHVVATWVRLPEPIS